MATHTHAIAHEPVEVELVEPTTLQRTHELLQQLAEARAAFRLEQDQAKRQLAAETARLASRQKQIRQLVKASRADRARIKTLSARFLQRMKDKWSTERRRVEAERAHLTQVRNILVEEAKQLNDIRERFHGDADAYKERLQSGWELLQEGQRRLLADREEAERWIAEQVQQIEQRAAQLEDREHHLSKLHVAAEARAAALATEIAGLETRAANTRALLQELDKQRAVAEIGWMGSPHGSTMPGSQLVTLAPQVGNPAQTNEAEQLLANLHEAEQELAREKQKLHVQRQDLDRRAAAIADERSILAEQAAALAAARDVWNSAELSNVDELETLAKALRAREQAADERDRQATEADRRRRAQEYEMWQLRVKLEAWQTALGEHEVAARAARERIDAELDARRDHLLRWESSLEEVSRTWNDLRDQQRTHLQDELERWASSRARYEAALAEQDQVREAFLAEAQQAAAVALALEEAHPTAGPKADRRTRVLRKKWERHFDRYRSELSKRRAEAAADAEEARERIAELQRTLLSLADRGSESVADRIEQDRERVGLLRHMEDSTTHLSLDQIRRQTTETEVSALRAEVVALSTALLGPTPPVELQLANRAA